MSLKNNKHNLTSGDIAKFGVLIGIVALSIVVTVVLWPTIVSLTTEEGVAQVTQAVRDSGPLAVLIMLGLQFLQVIVAFIPGEVVQIVAGILYGPFWGTVLILGGACGSTIIIYYLVQKLGAPFVQKMVPAETQKKLDFITRTSRIDAIVFVLFLIPGLPKDFITYLVSVTDVRPKRFFLFSTLGRAPGVIATSFAGSSIADGNWIFLLVIIVLVVVVFVVAFFKRDYVFKRFNEFADEGANTNEDTSSAGSTVSTASAVAGSENKVTKTAKAVNATQIAQPSAETSRSTDAK